MKAIFESILVTCLHSADVKSQKILLRRHFPGHDEVTLGHCPRQSHLVALYCWVLTTELWSSTLWVSVWLSIILAPTQEIVNISSSSNILYISYILYNSCTFSPFPIYHSATLDKLNLKILWTVLLTCSETWHLQ